MGLFEFIIAFYNSVIAECSGMFAFYYCIAFYSGTLFEYVLESNHREISYKLSIINFKMDEELVKSNNDRIDLMNRLREIEVEQKRILTIVTRIDTTC